MLLPVIVIMSLVAMGRENHDVPHVVDALSKLHLRQLCLIAAQELPPYYHTHQPHQLNFKCQFSTPTPTLPDKPNNLGKKRKNPLNLTRFDLFSLVFTSIFSHFFLYIFSCCPKHFLSLLLYTFNLISF